MNNSDGAEWFGIGVDTRQLERDMRRAEGRFTHLEKVARSEGTKIDGVFSMLARGAASFGMAWSGQEIIRSIVNIRGEFQKLEVAFNTMLGSRVAAERLMNQLVRTAATTPFSLQDVAGGAKQLLAYGLAAEDVNSTLVRLGDIAAGISIPLNDLIYLYGTTMAQGRLYTVDLNQFTGRGIPMLRELAKQFGVAEEEVKKLVEEGKVGFPQIKRAIEDLTDAGGQFGGLMEAQSKTIGGRISNISDSIDTMFNDIGRSSEGFIDAALGGVAYAVENYREVADAIMQAVTAYGAYKGTLMAIEGFRRADIALTRLQGTVLRQAVVERKLAAAANVTLSASEAAAAARTKLLTAAHTRLNTVMKLNPYMLAASAVALLAAGLYKVITRESELEKVTARLKAANEDYQKSLGAETIKLDTLFTQLEAAKKGSDEYRVVKERIQSGYGSYLDGLSAEKKSLEDIRGAYDAVSEAIKRKAQHAAMESYMETEANTLSASRVEARRALMEELEKKFKGQKDGMGKDLATTYYWKIVPVLEGKKEMDDEVKNIVNQFDRTSVQTYGTAGAMTVTTHYNSVAAAIDKARKAQEAYNTAISQGKKLFGDISGEGSGNGKGAGKVLNDYATKVKELTGKIREAQHALDELRNPENAGRELPGDSRSVLSAISGKARELEELRKTYKELTGKEYGKDPKGDPRKQVADRIRKIDEYAADVMEAQTDAELEIRQSSIRAMKDGYEKEKMQIDLNYDRLIEQNRKREREMVDSLKDVKVLEWQMKNPGATKEQTSLYRAGLKVDRTDLSNAQRGQIESYDAVAGEIRIRETRELYSRLLSEYAGYDEKRRNIDERYDADRRALEESPADTAEREKAVSVLEERRKAAIRSVNEEEAEAIQESSSLLVQLFSDASEQSSASLRTLVSQVRGMLAYLKETRTEDITPKFGFTAEQLRTLKESPEKLRDITEQVEKLEKTATKKNPFKSLADAVKDLFGKDGETDEGEKSMEKKIKNLGKSAADAADLIGGVADSLSRMFEAAGNQGMADTMSGISDAMDAVSNIGKGFEEGGLIGGISAVVGEGIGFITKAFQANARHKQALAEIMKEVTEQQRAYNLALYEETLLLKEADTVFGSLDYSRAVNSVRVMKEAWADLNREIYGTSEQQSRYSYKTTGNALFDHLSKVNAGYSKLKDAYSGLADIQIKTGHKKTGLFGWGKGKDLYSSILDVYPELIDESGKFDRNLAQSILDSRTFKDEGKEALQNMIDLYDEAEKAYEEVHGFLSGIFGDLGRNMSDALTDAFRNGTDAAREFANSVESMLENLGSQMIYSALFDPIIKDASKKMTDIMTNASLSDEQKFKQYVGVLDSLQGGLLGQQNEYERLMKMYQQLASERGLDLWKPEEVGQQGASSKGFAAASQDSVDELNGRFTAVQMDTSQIRQNVDEIRNLSLIGIGHLESISRNTHQLYEMNERLGKIERNTRKL